MSNRFTDAWRAMFGSRGDGRVIGTGEGQREFRGTAIADLQKRVVSIYRPVRMAAV